MEEHFNILATNFMKQIKTTRRKENYLKTHVPDRTVIYRAYWAYALQDLHKLYQMYY